jgi:hypothetical protein
MANDEYMGRDEKREYVDSCIFAALKDTYTPDTGFTADELTKYIWDNWEAMGNVEFARNSRYIKRRIAAIRHDKYNLMDERIKAGETDRTKIAPHFLPFPQPRRQFIWAYFNAVREPYISNVIKLLYHSSDGLDWVGRLLEKAFDVDANGNGRGDSTTGGNHKSG